MGLYCPFKLPISPNIQTFSDNYKFFKENKVTGIFAQGYADIPGDLQN
jgi:hypothetical protein